MDKSRKTSQYIGVCFDKFRNKFSSSIKLDNKKYRFGRFDDEVDAALAYDNFVKKNKLARRINFPTNIPNCKDGTRLIELTQGAFAVVDVLDYDRVNNHSWFAIDKGENTLYAGRNHWKGGKRLTQTMHNFILGTSNTIIDHIDMDGLNNTRSNLRECTNQENCMNQRNKKNTSSKYKGVSLVKVSGRYKAAIGFNYKTIYLGSFDSEVEAAKAYDCKASEIFGEYARLNF